MTATQPNKMTSQSNNPNRRQFMRRVGCATLGAGAAYYGGTQYAGSPVENGQAIAPLVAVGLIGAAGYLSGRAVEAGVKHFTGLGSAEDYDGLAAESLYMQARFDHQTIKSANDSVLTTVENLSQNASQVAYLEARGAVLEALNDGATPAESLDAGYTAIDDYILTNQKNLADRFTVAITQVEAAYTRVESNPDMTPSEVWVLPPYDFTERVVQLADGSDYTYSAINKTDGAIVVIDDDNRYYSEVKLKGVTPFTETGYDNIKPTMAARFRGVLHDLDAAWNDARTNIDEFVTGIGPSYTSGEISTEDITQPSDLFQMASDDSQTAYAAADLAGLGLEVNQDSSVTIELLDDLETLEGSVFLSKSPMGGSLQVGTAYNPEISRATDGSGNPSDTIDDYAGTQGDPVPLDGLAYIAYNTGDGSSTYGQIQQPFSVASASDPEGSNLSEVSYQPSGGQQTTTTNVDEVRSELQAMNDEIVRLEEEKSQAATNGGNGGGAGGFLDGGNSTLLAALAAVAGGAVLFRGNS